jgi:predicted metal-binding protein
MKRRADLEIADIFKQYYADYKKNYHVPDHIGKVVNAVISCRTATLGGHVEICEECGHTQISYNSCRNRHCPKCQFVKKEKWALDKNTDVLPVEYFHVVFTVPDRLDLLMHRNGSKLYGLLMRCAGKTITELGEEARFLDGRTGAICVLHTWGQKLDLHPHVHAIVPGGALSIDRESWVSCKTGYFLPVKVLSKRFRRIFLDGLKDFYRDSQLYLEGSLAAYKDKKAFQQLIDNLYEKDWVVYAKRPFKNVSTVIGYLSRYTHRIAISNYRILRVEDERVYFRFRDYRDANRQKVMSLPGVEFMRRFLLHVLPFRFVKIRYVGFLSNRTRKDNIRICRELLEVKPEDIPQRQEYADFAEFLLEVFGFDVRRCPECNGRLVFKRDFAMRYIRAP